MFLLHLRISLPTSFVRERLLLSRKWPISTSATRKLYRRKEGRREMGNTWIPQFDSASTSPSSTRPSSPGIAQNTSNEGTHSGTGRALSTRLDDDFPNGQILTTPNLTFTSAEVETAIRYFWREREMADSWIPHFYSSNTSPSWTRPSSPEIAQNTSNEGTHSGTESAFSTRLDEDFPNGQILTPPNFSITFTESEPAIRNFWSSWIPQFYSFSTSPSWTRPSSPGIAQNTSNEGTHSGTERAFSTRLDDDFPNGQILTTPNSTFTSAEVETAFRNFWREREMGDSRIPHFYSCSTSPSWTSPSSPGNAQNTSNEGTHSVTGSAFSTRLDEYFPNGQILITPPDLRNFTSAELETATRNFRPDTVRGSGIKLKLVLEVDMHDAKSRSKAMKIAVGLPGVISATIEPDKNQLTVVGDGLDSVYLTTLLRKRMSSKIERLFCLSIVSSELVSVTPVDEKKKEEEKKPEPIVAWPFQYYPTVAQPHFLYEAPYSRNDNCSIM